MAAGGDKEKPRRVHGRSLSDFTSYVHKADGKPLWPAERKLLEACRTGDVARIAERRPDTASDANRIRAGFLRFLILGGDEAAPVHEQGVQVDGAWIDGALDLEGCRSERAILCWNCRFSDVMTLRGARLETLNLTGCEVPGLQGDGARVAGDVFLRYGFKATGAVRVLGAEIGGDIDCSGGAFEPKEGNALSFDKVTVKGNVFLGNGFKATATVRLLGAEMGGDLACSGGVFEPKEGHALSFDNATVKGNVFLRNGFKATGEVRLVGAEIGGDLDCSSGVVEPKVGNALNCQAATVKGGLVLRSGATMAGKLALTKARVGALVDDPASWPEQGNLVLDGFTYDSFDGGAPTGAAKRADWLLRHYVDMLSSDFRPQPWKQAIRVLRAMGHERDAQDLAIRFEEQRRKAGAYSGVAKPLHWLYGALAGYGYRPLRLLAGMMICWLCCAVLYENAAERGIMAPTNPLVFDGAAYQATCRPRAGREAHWLHGDCRGPNEYTAFSPLLYSLDLILPLVDLQQDRDWAPMVTRDAPTGSLAATETLPLGVFTRAVMWFEILFGWVISLLFVAILSGLVRKSADE